MNLVQSVQDQQLKDKAPVMEPGDTVRVHIRIVEGDRERVQVFQGVVIGRQNGGLRETFTVRKISFGVGVERTFPVHSPSIAKLEVVTRGKVRRAKLYYLRELRGKKARIKERREAYAELAPAAAEELVEDPEEPTQAEVVEPEAPETEDTVVADAEEAPEAEATEPAADDETSVEV